MKISYENKLIKSMSLLVLISPVFFLTVRHWTNLVVLFLFISCLYLLEMNKRPDTALSLSGKRAKLICAIFVAHLAAIAISQLFRLDFYPNNWDAPLRLVLCIPIFLAIANGSLRPFSSQNISLHWLTLVFPLTLIWTLFFRINWPTSWGPVDLTTYFVDPLSFGSYSLLFSLLTLLGLSEYWSKLGFVQRCLCVLGILSGFYLSLKSGSRTGWFNLPVFFGIWAYFVLKPKLGLKKTILLMVVFISLLFVSLFINGYLLDKFIMGLKEISNYKLNQVNADTSVELRLSFYRMGITYFLERPLAGWGDLSWMAQMDRPELAQFASEFAREAPKHGFHSEIITKSVSSGIWGFIASIAFFCVVFLRAIQGVKLKSTGEHRIISLSLLVFISHLFIAGLTTEITNLVFLSSFIGLTLAVLLGEQIYLEENCKHDLN
jgi:O-antigen ligase